MQQLSSAFDHVFLAQRPYIFYWFPIAMGSGIGGYFSAPSEAPFLVGVIAICSSLLIIVLCRHVSPTRQVFGMVVSAILLGSGVACMRSHAVREPVLQHRLYGEVSGKVVFVDVSSTGAIRYVLERPALPVKYTYPAPLRVRISDYSQTETRFQVGDLIKTTAFLGPPQPAVEPNGFDFRRYAYFRKIGAVGYTKTPIRKIGEDMDDFATRFGRWRGRVSDYVYTHMPAETSGFAVAIITGDRSRLDKDTIETLRETNLAHLLAISGLHMGLLANLLFQCFRLILSLVQRPWSTLYGKKIAALCALFGAGFYLAMSGGAISTQRAFIMIAFMLVAVILDRRALSLRSVAAAAILIMIWMPEAVLEPGFQMSFAATSALVLVFQYSAQHLVRPRFFGVNFVISLLLSSFTAGMATLPIAAFHFNQISHIGFVANTLAVPIMGLWIAPSAIFTAVLAAFGADHIGFIILSQGIHAIQSIAAYLASWEGAVRHVATPNAPVLSILTISCAMLVLWQDWGKGIGAVGIIITCGIWAAPKRPDILIAPYGNLIGVMTEAGRGLSKEQAHQFVATVWMENDGLRLDRSDAYDLWQARRVKVFHHWSKKAHNADIECKSGEIHITRLEHSISGECSVFHRGRAPSSLAIWLKDDGTIARIVSSYSITPRRHWTGLSRF